MPFGLSENTIEKINSVFKKYTYVEQAILYGSRAKGNYRNGSDIDLVVSGDSLTLSKLLAIENELDDLMLPYTIDISILNHIGNPDLLDHIRRVGKVFYERPDANFNKHTALN